jgi:hypothetical protein
LFSTILDTTSALKTTSWIFSTKIEEMVLINF